MAEDSPLRVHTFQHSFPNNAISYRCATDKKILCSSFTTAVPCFYRKTLTTLTEKGTTKNIEHAMLFIKTHQGKLFTNINIIAFNQNAAKAANHQRTITPPSDGFPSLPKFALFGKRSNPRLARPLLPRFQHRPRQALANRNVLSQFFYARSLPLTATTAATTATATTATATTASSVSGKETFSTLARRLRWRRVITAA